MAKYYTVELSKEQLDYISDVIHDYGYEVEASYEEGRTSRKELKLHYSSETALINQQIKLGKNKTQQEENENG